jgi:hypothetical protein
LLYSTTYCRVMTMCSSGGAHAVEGGDGGPIGNHILTTCVVSVCSALLLHHAPCPCRCTCSRQLILQTTAAINGYCLL